MNPEDVRPAYPRSAIAGYRRISPKSVATTGNTGTQLMTKIEERGSPEG